MVSGYEMTLGCTQSLSWLLLLIVFPELSAEEIPSLGDM